MQVKLYDTTLRDGSQGEGVSFSAEDKIRIAKKLDEFGMDYIEGGWPGSNPKDMIFFERARNMTFKHAKISAFGSTRRAGNKAENDPNVAALLDSCAPVVAIVSKTWDMHVKEVLRVSLDENLDLIRDTVAHLKKHGKEVVYDAEQFFDGFKANPDYAMATLKAAARAGADVLVLCDTNGGTLTSEITAIVKRVKGEIDAPLGIHTHNDCELAVANTLAAVELGVGHVQGTINGYGERCGNANLCSIVPNLKLKMGIDCITDDQLRGLTGLSRYVSELLNLAPNERAAFVGSSAFAHKGGIHVNAVMKNTRTYEHIDPEVVGNHRRVLISDLSGKSNITSKAKEYGIDLDDRSLENQEILKKLKDLEHSGYMFEGAEGSFEILMKKALGKHKSFFSLKGFRVIVEKNGDAPTAAEATIKVQVGGVYEHTAADGNGPVNALDNALRKALEEFYPGLKEVKLTDYKVRVLGEEDGTAAKIRVLIESTDGEDSWGTVGVDTNIIEASWQALVDSIDYRLMKEEEKM